MPPTEERAIAGQAAYTKGMLSIYDFFVLSFSNRYVWKCPTSKLEALYNENLSSNHLDVGVGTGYFLDRCQFPSESPRVALMDMNADSLEFTSKRIARYGPETYRQNILERIRAPVEPFDSVGINYLLHCVPGSIAEKSVAFDHLRAVMNPGARIFGSTILQGSVARSWTARKLMALYNDKGVFTNSEDDVDGLETALLRRFHDVTLDVAGCVALFSGHVQQEHQLQSA